MVFELISAGTSCLIATMCSGSVTGKVIQTTPSGSTTYEIEGEWKKNVSTAAIEQ
jgi:hypothetical protein